ncbi:MAG: sugar O-acetyltransferase [Bacteroidota bacterium]
MTELEKMLADELYDASDPQLTQMRIRARKLWYAYNQLAEDQQAERYALLSKLLGKVGQQVDIQPPFYCDYGAHIFLGENVFMNFNCTILDCNEVHIGQNTMFGPNVQIYTAYHPLAAAERIKGPELAAPIRIGDNCWIGGGAIICPKVSIGDNTTIGAGSVVTKDIPSNVFAAGNPCRVIKQID